MRWMLCKSKRKNTSSNRSFPNISIDWGHIFLIISLILLSALPSPASEASMIEINECSVYANNELVKIMPDNAIFVPTELLAVGGTYIKVCKNKDYYRIVEFIYRIQITNNYDAKETSGHNIDNLLNDQINFIRYDDMSGILYLAGGKILKAFIPDDTFYVAFAENESRVRIQIVEPGLYYATIYNVRGDFINYEGFMVDEKGRNADDVVKDPKKYLRYARDDIILGGYKLVKKILTPEELERLKKEGKIDESVHR
jgi:hypothetical protein